MDRSGRAVAVVLSARRPSAVAAGARSCSSPAVNRASLPSIYRARKRRRIDLSRTARSAFFREIVSRHATHSRPCNRITRYCTRLLLFFGSVNDTRPTEYRLSLERQKRVLHFCWQMDVCECEWTSFPLLSLHRVAEKAVAKWFVAGCTASLGCSRDLVELRSRTT